MSWVVIWLLASLLVLAPQRTQCASSALWEVRPPDSAALLSEAAAEEELIEVSFKDPNACLFDVVSIDWQANRPLLAKEFSGIQLAISASTLDAAFTSHLASSLLTTESSPHEAQNGMIRCASLDPLCSPEVKGVVISTDVNEVSIEFTSPVTKPSLQSRADINKAFEIVPALSEEGTGQWVSLTKVILLIGGDDREKLVNAYRNQERVVIAPRVTPLEKEVLTGKLSFRPSQPGYYSLFAYDTKSHSRVSPLRHLTVEKCGADLFPPVEGLAFSTLTLSGSANVSHTRKDDVRVLYSMKSVLAVNNKTSIVLDQTSLPELASHSWSVSLWIRILEPPTGQYRSLLFKGCDYNEARTGRRRQQRTLSTWLLPDSNKLHIAVSTHESDDVSLTSRADLPLNQWTFLTWVVHNARGEGAAHTAASPSLCLPAERPGSTDSPRPGPDRLALYVNGALDVQAEFRSPLRTNRQPLRILNDGVHRGPLGFVHSVRVWRGALSPAQVWTAYHADVPPTTSRVEAPQCSPQPPSGLSASLRALDAAVAWLSASPSPLLPFTTPAARAPPDRRQLSVLRPRIAHAVQSCASAALRLDLYSTAAGLGDASSLVSYAKLVLFGVEDVDGGCGCLRTTSEEVSGSPAQAAEAAVYALAQGQPAAIMLVSFLLSHVAGRAEDDDGWLSSPGGEARPESFPRPGDDPQADQRWMDLRARLRQVLPRGQVRQRGVYYARGEAVERQAGRAAACIGSHGEADDRLSLLALGLVYLAAMHADLEALVYLAHRHESGRYAFLEQDLEAAGLYSLPAVQHAASLFQARGAQLVVESDRLTSRTADSLHRGNLGEHDEHLAYLRVRAQEGDVSAMLSLAAAYYYGTHGLPRDPPAALDYYLQAHQAGHPAGQCGAANMFVKGEGTRRNVTAALELYTRAAAQDSAQALNGLGYLYFYGVTDTDDAGRPPRVLLPRNQSRAFAYFVQASEASGADGDAFFNVAYCLEHGLGVARDFSHAVQAYTQAAYRGHFQSIQTMGDIWMTGGASSLWSHCQDVDDDEEDGDREAAACVGQRREARRAADYLQAARSLGPWAQFLRRGLDLFLASSQSSSLFSSFSSSRAGWTGLWDAVLSLVGGRARETRHLSPTSTRTLHQALYCYLYAADLGYEVGGNNAVFLLQRLLASSTSPPASDHPLPGILLRTLTTQLEVHNQSEAAFHLAQCFLSPAGCDLPRRDATQALRYYELAAWMTPPYPLAYVYLGLVHHFQLLDLPPGSYGTAASQRQQARYYYALGLSHIEALQDTASQAVPWTWVLKVLLQTVDRADQIVWQPVQWILQRVATFLWAN